MLRRVPGPVGLELAVKPLTDGLTVVVDKGLEGRENLVAGANKLDYHLRNVTPGATSPGT